MDITARTGIRRLVAKRPGVEGLEAAKSPSPIMASTAVGNKSATAAISGIASPLIENARATYVTKSTDGILSWSVPSQIDFIDAAGREVSFLFSQP